MEMEEIGSRTYNAFLNLYTNLIEIQQDQNVIAARKMDGLAHAKEFGTIKICGPRRSGHTSSIIKFFIDNIKTDKKEFAVVLPNYSMANRFNSILIEKLYKMDNPPIISKQNNHQIEFKNGSVVYFWSMYQIEHRQENSTSNNENGINLDSLIVDCASFISEKAKKQIYNIGIEAMRYKEYVSFIFME